MEQSLFEQMGGSYRQVGDFLLPNFEAPENKKPVGVWGQRHHDYLHKHKRLDYEVMLVSGKLNDCLADIDCQAEEMFFQLVKQFAEQNGITETLKSNDQMEWVRRMNAAREQAIETVNNELIYN